MADVFTVPAARLVRVPPQLTDQEAALIEPLATFPLSRVTEAFAAIDSKNEVKILVTASE